MSTDDRAETYRAQIRETLQRMSARALEHQDTVIRGGIDREELERELRRRAELEVAPPAPLISHDVSTDQLEEWATRAEGYAEHNAERFPETAAHQRRAASEYRAELQRRDDDARAIEEGDEQRDYAEERYNAGLLRDDYAETTPDRRPEPTTPDGATAHDLARELLEQPGNSWRLTPRVRQLAELVLASDTLEELER